MKIGFIGVGVMGKGMVKNLCKANYDVSIYTRTKDKVLDILDQVTWCDSIKECVKDKDIIMTMVGFPKDVEEVYFESDGISFSTFLMRFAVSAAPEIMHLRT